MNNQNQSKHMDINIAPKNEFIVSLDIGTTKIVMVAGQKNETNQFEVIGYGKVPSPSGAIRNGQVLNVEETANSIRKVLELTLKSNQHIESIAEVYVGIAGEHVKCFQTRGDLVRQGNALEETIVQEEVDTLIANQYKSFVPASDEIMHVYPLHYYVDNHTEIINPVGMYGNKLGGNFNLISADKSAINQIRKSIEKAELSMKGIFLQPTASSKAVMCQPDSENTIAILDIGGGTSDLAIYQEGKLIHTVVIPMGGEVITQDIQKGLGILKSQAEALKKQFGAAMITQESNGKKYTITIPGYRGLSSKEINPNVLCGIIQARIQEILHFVNHYLQSVGLEGKHLSAGLIITGGGAQLKHLKQFTEFKTGAEVRIGFANEHLAPGQDKALKSPALSTSIGILIEGFNNSLDEFKHRDANQHGTESELKINIKANNSSLIQQSKDRKNFFGPVKKSFLKLFEENNDTKF